MFNLFAKSWRDHDGEGDMTDEDWAKRGTEQAMSMLNGLDPHTSSADADGDITGGCYNGDYPQSYHDKLNQQLEEDEYYEAGFGDILGALFGGNQKRLDEKRGR